VQKDNTDAAGDEKRSAGLGGVKEERRGVLTFGMAAKGGSSQPGRAIISHGDE
jgi:hypothetical protein